MLNLYKDRMRERDVIVTDAQLMDKFTKEFVPCHENYKGKTVYSAMSRAGANVLVKMQRGQTSISLQTG